MRYILVSDDSGHQYIIPEEKSDHWYEWLDKGDPYDEEPEYAERVEGYLSFTDPKTEK